MSTFKGVAKEFPDIRIDYFRASSNNQPGAKAPLAFFLSHIHSDHLSGLEHNRAGPFIFCSEVTKELLLKLERRAHRLNQQKRVVEKHDYTYSHLKSRLRTLPLDTPTEIELRGGKFITVTAFDANHCPGAVMFLIEDENASILYTGDIRAEDRWIESLKGLPTLLPYHRGFKRLSKIYLDTSCCADHDHLHLQFAPKADGIHELLDKISRYPDDIKFHFHAWTIGYEDVWEAIASNFNTKIHIDAYQQKLYGSLRRSDRTLYKPFLTGHTVGNTEVDGRLSEDISAKFHSCDPRLECPGLVGQRVVYIKPVITRHQNQDIEEAALGTGDLDRHDELAIDTGLQDILGLLGHSVSENVRQLLKMASNSLAETVPIKREESEEDYMDLERLKTILTNIAHKQDARKLPHNLDDEKDPDWIRNDYQIEGSDGFILPRRITFPYSRHSSYSELCNFVAMFQPLQVYPCVDDPEVRSENWSMKSLFGKHCSGELFDYDNAVLDERYLPIIPGDGSQVSLMADEHSQQHSTQRSYESDITIPDKSDIILKEDKFAFSRVSKPWASGREATRNEPEGVDSNHSSMSPLQSSEPPQGLYLRPRTERCTSVEAGYTGLPGVGQSNIKATPDNTESVQSSAENGASPSYPVQEDADLIEADLANPTPTENFDRVKVARAYRYVKKRSYSSTDLKLKCTAIPRIRYKQPSPEI